MFVPIGNTPRDYAWGSHTAIADLLGSAASGGPEAELWLGAHAGSPARIVADAPEGVDDLRSWIGSAPEQALGPDLARRGARLPFLLKVLAADAPLSLQAHPDLDRARLGFAREEEAGIAVDAFDRNYRDAFHKPELIVAVSETFDALCGFRPVAEALAIVDELGAADAAGDDPQPAALDLLRARLTGDDGLREAVEWLLRDGRGEDTGEVSWLVERVVALSAVRAADPASPFRAAFATVGFLAAHYPGDPGIVISLLLNHVTLRRGEALYLPAGNMHAYLRGLGIELMAESDNVLRGGLTPKHIDIEELVDVLDFSPLPVPYLRPEQPGAGVQTFRPDVPDFVLHQVRAADASETPIPLDGPAIALCTSGDVAIAGAHGETTFGRGASVYITPDEGAVTVSGDGEVFIATVGAGYA
ncbi:mannose-6-phosphate isomerase, class I [Agromyces mangrovi Wang et al. 2018]|uniref:mannose-6-phosphate isomerase, class I n=1 Tax=Agromyces mangrovi TaxID=1858653 RepID=UPI002573C786|nr:mannose-6-phosphate isomerase, class I [Agromyces mangrovi]BDZ65800.1 mannose-6-phosphate isomerase, class I [Agromyces mangrovi]